jgi:hypothetical protein
VSCFFESLALITLGCIWPYYIMKTWIDTSNNPNDNRWGVYGVANVFIWLTRLAFLGIIAFICLGICLLAWDPDEKKKRKSMHAQRAVNILICLLTMEVISISIPRAGPINHLS